MPELPEVETVVRGLQRTVTKCQITDVQIFRENPITPVSIDEFCEKLIGRRIKSVTRRAKYILFELEPKFFLLAHLRMTGKFIVTDGLETPHKHHRVWFTLNRNTLMIFEDMRCFGTLELVESIDDCLKLKQLGIEPLSSKLTTKYLQKCFSNSSNSIKNLLLDQKKIVGIGNIYAAEILFDSKISPLREGKDLSLKDYEKLIRSTQQILKQAIKKNGTSISDFRKIDEKTGEFQNFLKVYGKTEQPCPKCSTPIQRIKQQQRSSFYCPSCQS